ncbi:MAG: outer membrane protein assembly factor [bacterium]|nr:outer membrane protein assembly factor [bacterium]
MSVRRLALAGLVLALACGGPSAAAGAEGAEDRIRVEGVEGALLANVQAHVRLLAASHSASSARLRRDALADGVALARLRRDPARLRRLVRAAPGQVAAALAPFGYDRPTVQVVAGEDGRPEALVIDAGPPTRITELEVRFTGGELSPEKEQRLLALLGLKVGRRFDHTAYEEGKLAVLSALHDRGWPLASLVEHRVLVDRQLGTAEVSLRWDVGPTHVFGEVRFQGAQFPDAFMQRYVRIRPGDPYSRQAILRLTRRLTDSPYFRSAEVTPRLDQASIDHRVPLLARVVPMPPRQLEFGASGGSDSGFSLEGLYERRWLNPRGHSFRAQLSPGTERSRTEVTYSIPDRRRLDRLVSFGLDALDETTKTNDKRNAAFSIVHQRLWRKWRHTGSLRFLAEDFVVGGEAGESELLLLQGSLRRSRPKREAIPRSGWSLTGGFKLASDSLASDTSVLQLDLRGRRLLGLGEKTRLIGRVRLGWTEVDDFDHLPASLRYYAGGDRSLRGFAFESLGPRNQAGEVIGGRHLAVAGLEIERGLSKVFRRTLPAPDLLRLAAFVDAGNAYDDFGSDFGDEIEVGAGLGVRLATPIGMVRLDLAYPLTADDAKPRLHFTVGPDL